MRKEQCSNFSINLKIFMLNNAYYSEFMSFLNTCGGGEVAVNEVTAMEDGSYCPRSLYMAK